MYTYGHAVLGVLIAFRSTHNVMIFLLKYHSLPPHFKEFPYCCMYVVQV